MRTSSAMRWVSAVCASFLTAAVGAATLSTSDTGIAITSDAGKYMLEYPLLMGSADKEAHKLTDKKPSADKKSAALKYDGGCTIDVALQADGSILYTVANVPADVKNIQTRMLVPPSSVSGGTYRFDSKPAQPFPAEKPAKPHLYQGQAQTLTLKNAAGKAITFTTPFTYTYSQLSDNREWGWSTFMWQAHSPYNPDVKVYRMAAVDGETAAPVAAPVAAAKPAEAKPAPKPEAKPMNVGANKIEAGEKGIRVEAGLVRFTLEYPQLIGKDNKVVHKLIEPRASGNKATLKYEGGGQIDLEIKGQDLSLTFSNVQGDVSQFSCMALIDYNISNGGTFKVDSQAEQPFPAEKPAKPHLYQNHARKITFKSYDGRSVSLGFPEFTYLQLTDNREWGWKIYALRTNTPYNPDVPVQHLTISMGSSTEGEVRIKPQVDQFGQTTRIDYPDKLKTIDELKADVESEKAYYASFTPNKTDTYGGQPGSGQKLGLTKTGFFHVEKKADRWYLVDPEGNAFFHLAIGCFQPTAYTYVAGREQIYEWIPPRSGQFAPAYRANEPQSFDFHQANLIRKYGKGTDPTEFLDIMIPRVRQFGFNSGGPFTGNMNRQSPGTNFPYVSGVPISQWTGYKMIPGVRETWDPFDPAMQALIDKRFSESLPKGADNPLIIGFFLVNEPLYEDLPKVVPTLDGKWACKRQLVAMLKGKYQTIDAFNKAWNLSAGSFDELNDKGLAVATKSASEDVREFTGQFLEAYFKLVADTFHKYDKNHMLIGNRLQSGTINSEQLCGIMGKYLDVVSFNYYTYYLDKDFLNRIYKWTGGKPMILSEFYYNSAKDSGLPGGVKDVNSQEERGLGYRNYVEQAASLPYILGIEWFTLVDQSVTGNWFSKYNGENGNTGLFSVVDRPWKVMISHMARTNARVYDIMAGTAQPFVYEDPRFNQKAAGTKTLKITRATGPITLDGTTANWPGVPAEVISGKRLVEGSTAGSLEASFKTCWDDRNLYVMVNVTDDTPMKNTGAADHIWSGDAVELFIGSEKLDQGGTLLFTDRQVLLRGANSDKGMAYFGNSPKQYECQVKVIADVSGKGYTLQAAIPFAALNIAPKIGTTMRFDLGVDNSDDGTRRLAQIMWNGTNRNSGDRTAWGQAVLEQ